MPPRFGWKIDSRDGKVYRTVLMPDGLWWLAENVAWDGAGLYPGGDADNLADYGKLYRKSEHAAAVIAGCDVPTQSEIDAMVASVGGYNAGTANALADAGFFTSGTNSTGFAARPAGRWAAASSNYQWFGLTFCLGSATGDPATFSWFGVFIDDGVISFSSGVGNDYNSIRLIVRSGNIPDPDPVEPLRLTNIVNPLTVKLLSHNSNFRPVTKLNRNSFALGSFAFEGNADWDVDNDTPYEDLVGGIYENFPIGLTDTEVVIEELFKVTHNEFSKRLSAKCVFIPQDYDFNDDIFIGLNSGFSEDSCTIIASDTMSSAKFGSKRGVMLKGSWTVSTIGAAQFIAWLRRNIGKRFVKTISTFAGYVWTIGEDVSFTIDCELVTISASFYGVDKARTLDVTWEKHPEDALLITGTFDNSTITSTAVNRLGETVPSFVANNGDSISVFLNGNPDGDYRVCVMQNNKVTPWIDFKHVDFQIELFPDSIGVGDIYIDTINSSLELYTDVVEG